MSDWSEWSSAVLGFILTILGLNYRMEKKRNEDNYKELSSQAANLAQKMVKVEAELMTEREVREVLKDYFDPFVSSMTEIQKDVHKIEIHLASLPKEERR